MMTEIPAVRGFIRMCTDGWEQGWHERNGGNLTYRMKPEEVEQCCPFFTAPREWNSMGVQADNLKGEYFITTGSGKFLRNVQDDPEHNIGIVEINDTGDSWRIVWGLENGARPTSEFPSHFMNHSVRKAATNGAYRVIYHAHTPSLIAMTYIMPLTARDFTRALWQSATECPVVFPGGVGVLPIDRDGNIILVRQFRYPFDTETLEMPAGKMDHGPENAEECGVRELAEETGCTAGRIVPLGAMYPSPGFLTEVTYLFAALDLTEGETHPDEDEFVETVRLPIAEVERLIAEDRLRDAKTIAAMYRARLKNLF